ncbi:hypothetical protein I545_4233 [Mycobacterium kansasii 662]|uniref:Uncharacterized protein n=1 Tax=Mycobacterium kansasii 662 TaxID=1299326 RepID=X7ZAN0_MYCKA|nr:hypothetical protein I545_4233 [Mycobacterium kansasii 662]KEP40673.1 hypothetical protein MKSMC1_41400 [Mycobacterium kansasii]
MIIRERYPDYLKSRDSVAGPPAASLADHFQWLARRPSVR